MARTFTDGIWRVKVSGFQKWLGGFFVGLVGLAVVSQLGCGDDPTLGVTVTPIVTTDTAIPGESGSFTSFQRPYILPDKVVFGASGSGGQLGVYASGLGFKSDLRVVVDKGTRIPHTDFEFTQFSRDVGNDFETPGGSITSDLVVFIGGYESRFSGVFVGTDPSNIEAVVTTSDENDQG